MVFSLCHHHHPPNKPPVLPDSNSRLCGSGSSWQCLTKVDHALKIGVLNIPAPVRMTPCHPTPGFVDRGHLDRENEILGRQVLSKSWSCYEDRCPEHPSSYQDDPLSSQTPTLDSSAWQVDDAMKTGVLNIPVPARMTPCPPRFYLKNQIRQNRRTIKPVIVIQLKSLTFKWRRTCSQ